jgi:acyl-CoA synthetase (AMP-forming)/AMP-acid ligase II
MLESSRTYPIQSLHSPSTTARSLGGGKSRWRGRASSDGKSQNAPFLQQGDRVLLVFLPSLDFILAFLGCLYAGLVPVPVFPPDPRRLRKDLYMFASIQASSRARVALTHRAYDHLKKARRRHIILVRELNACKLKLGVRVHDLSNHIQNNK